MAYRAYKRKRSGGKSRMAMKRRVKARMFRPPKTSMGASAKSVVIESDSSPVTRMTKTLYDEPLAAIPHSTSNNINTRQRNMLNLRGFKVCMEVQNDLDTPIYFNWAVVCPKQSGSIDATKWFRGTSSNRVVGFNSGTLNGLEYNCRPLNSDAMHILCHKRYKIIPGLASSTTESNSGNSHITIQKYIKYNRVVKFTDNADNEPENGNPVLVFWCSEFLSGNSATATTAISVSRQFTTYFREVKA